MAEATHLLSLPLRHKMSDISDLAAELQRYLLLDGSREMLGTFKAQHIIPKTHATYNLGSAANRWLDSYITGLNSVNLYGGAGTCSIATRTAWPDDFWQMISWDGAAYQVVWKAHFGRCDIYRAGDITLLSAKRLNALDGALQLPNTRPASPQAGDTRYEPATDTFEIYDGSTWRAH